MLSASNASPSASLDDSGPAKGQSASVTGTWHVLATGPDATSELLSSEDSREFKILDTNNSTQTTLFKVDSLAVLGSDGAKETKETFEAHGNASSFCVVAGNEVHILTEDCAEHGATITFECQVESAALSPRSNFIAIGDSSGSLHFAHTASGSVVFSQDLAGFVGDEAEGGTFQWIGFSQRQTEETSTLLVSLPHTLLRFSNIDLPSLDTAFLSSDFPAAAKVKEVITMERIELGEGTVRDVCVVGMGLRDERVFVGGNEIQVYRKSPLTGKTMLLDTLALPGPPDPLVRFCADPSSSTPTPFLALFSSGRVALIDPRSALFVNISDPIPGAYDARIVSSTSVAVFTPSHLSILELPSLRAIQRYPLLGPCTASQVTLDTRGAEPRMHLHFLELCGGQLIVRRLSETAPHRRLAALVRAGRWDDALSLASTFGLDSKAVLKAKVAESIADSHVEPVDAGPVLQDLKEIADPQFSLESSLAMLPRDLEDAYLLLGTAKETGLETAKVQSQLKRLGTFQLVSTASHSAHAGEEFDRNAWFTFRGADLAGEMAGLVASGDLFRAVVVWRRHHRDSKALVSLIPDILGELPSDVKPGAYLGWLRDEVLPLLSTQGRGKVGVWIEKRARMVEGMEKRPHMALDIVKLLDVEARGGKIEGPPTPQQHVGKTVAMASVGGWSGEEWLGSVAADGLKAQLKDLVTLWDRHDLKLSLAEYGGETPQSIAIELLDRVSAPEMLKEAVEEHFRPYAQANDLSCDELLTEYAGEIMESAGSGGSLAGSPWEARVLALVGCMGSVETKIETVLEVMRRAPVPWSAELDAVIAEALGWTTVRRIDELREQYRLMQLKKMLLRYDIVSFNVSDLSLATGLMRHVLSRTDMTDVMPDALQVVAAYHHLNKLDAFATRLRNLFAEDQGARALSLLHTGEESTGAVPSPKEHALTLADQASICGEVFEWALVNMEEAVAFQDVTEEKGGRSYRIALAAAIDVCDNVIRHHLNGETVAAASVPAGTVHISRGLEWQKRLQELGNLKSLFDDFGFMVSPAEYHEDILAVQNRLLGEMAREVFRYASGKGKEGEHKKAGRTHNDLYRLAELLGVARDDLKGHMAEEAARCGDFRTVSLLCKEVIERGHDEKLGSTLRGVAGRLTAYAAQHSQVFRDIKDSLFSNRLTGDIKKLAQQSVAYCSQDLLPEALDAFKVYEVQHSVFNQCDAGDYETLLGQMDEEEEEDDIPSYGAGGSGSSSSAVIWHPPSRSKKTAPTLDHEVQNVEDRYGKSIFEDQFYENGLVLETESTMGLAAKFAISSLQPVAAASTSSGKSKSKSTEAQGPLASGRDLVDYLGRNQCRMLTLQVWQRLLEYSIRKNPDGLTAEAHVEDLGHRGYFELISSLLQTVLSTRHIDESLALGLMLCLPLQNAFEAFKAGMQTTGTEYHRLIKIATIGRAAGAAWLQRSFQLDCQQLGTNARWWQQLRLLEISFDEAAFRASRGGEYQRQLVVPLLQKTSFDVLTVLEFSRSYNIEDDLVLLNYIQLLIQHDDGSSYAWKIAAVVDDVVNREKLLRLLLDRCYPCVSPYDYERQQFVFAQARRLDDKEPVAKKGSLLLEILTGYQRAKAPSESEIVDAKRIVDDSSYYSSSETAATLLQRFPLTTKRLPLKPFMQGEKEFWPLLQAELSEETLPKLIPLTIPLGISPDRFYETVIRSMATATKQAFDAARSQERHSEVSPEVASGLRLKFADFRPLLLKYREISDALQMTAFTAGVFPCGPDRIQAYKTALHLAEKWVQKLQALDAKSAEEMAQLDKASTAHSKIKHMLAATETEHQLRSLNLTFFLEYLQRPQDLIVQLYTQKASDMVVQKDPMDLHSVVDDIGKRHGIDVEKLRLKLIHHWLSQEIPISKDDKDNYLPSIRIQMNNVANSATERTMQLRLLYLLRSQPIEKSVHDMIQLALQPSTKVVNMTRIRTLSVLFQLANAEEISKQMSDDQLKNYLQTLLYLTDFEELRIPQTIKEFTGCDKEALVRSLWLNHNTELKALQLICNISIDFRLWDTTLWENVLQRLLKHGSYPYLMGILEHVSAVPELSQVKFLPKLWDNVILGFLGRLETSAETEKASAYLDVVQLIQKCPFLPQLSMDAIVDNFSAISASDPSPKAFLISLRTLAALPRSAEVLEATDKVLAGAPEETLRKSLDLLEKAAASMDIGHDFDYYNDVLKSMIFDTIDDGRIYDCLLKTSHLIPMVNYLVESNRAHNMILAVLKQGKQAEAFDLVKMHFSTLHGAIPDMERDEMFTAFFSETISLFEAGDQAFIRSFGV